jgi:hypothetical protein
MLGLLPVKQLHTTAQKPGATRRPLFRDAMQWVRRIHLYSGLFMFPWVMLYGITALLFNHPAAFPDRPGRVLQRADFAGTALQDLANPKAEAEKIVAALNAKFGDGETSQPPYRLIDPDKARYTRDKISARARGDGQEHTVLYDLPSGTAFVTTEIQSANQRAPFATRGLKTTGSLAERVKTGLPKALTNQGLAAEEAGIAVGTEVVFYVDSQGGPWKATYNIQTGAVSGTSVIGSGDLTWRGFLTQLHLSHGYATQGGARRLWAIGVDAMFVSMVFWGLSGLCMWWQIKAVRRTGAAILVAGLASSLVLAALMHQLLDG